MSDITEKFHINRNALGGFMEAHITQVPPSFELNPEITIRFMDGKAIYVYEGLANDQPSDDYSLVNGWVYRPKNLNNCQMLVIWND